MSTTKQLRKQARDIIDFETSYQVIEIIESKLGTVKMRCKTALSNIVEIHAVFSSGKVRLEAPGMGTLLVKSIINPV